MNVPSPVRLVTTYGLVRAQSCHGRLTVGRVWICSVVTCEVDPVWFGLVTSSARALTVIASVTAASGMLIDTSEVVPRVTSLRFTVVALKPSRLPVTLYGP